MKLLLQRSFPQLCAESLTRGASSPSRHCAGGLPKAHHVAGAAEVHSSHLLIHLAEVPLSLLILLQSVLILWSNHLSHHSTLRSNDILRKSHHTSLCRTSKSIGHSHSYHHPCALPHDRHRLSHQASHHPGGCRHRNSHGWETLKMSRWLCGKWHRGGAQEHTWCTLLLHGSCAIQ